MSNTTKKYGWFSLKYREQYGYIKYLMADGTIQEISFLSDSPTESGTGWDDSVCVGEVKKFVSNHSIKKFDFIKKEKNINDYFHKEVPHLTKEEITMLNIKKSSWWKSIEETLADWICKGYKK